MHAIAFEKREVIHSVSLENGVEVIRGYSVSLKEDRSKKGIIWDIDDCIESDPMDFVVKVQWFDSTTSGFYLPEFIDKCVIHER